MTPQPPSEIYELVFGRAPPPVRRRLAIGLAAAVLLHAALWGVTRLSEESLESWAARLAAQVHDAVAREQAIEIEPPSAPPPAAPQRPPPPPPLEPPAEPTPPIARHRGPATPEPDEPPPEPPRAPPPAEAARVVTREESRGPVDLTGFTLVQGSAKAYAGGTTTADGTSRQPVYASVVPPRADGGARVRPAAAVADAGVALVRAPPGPPPPPDRSRPVSLEADEWRCPWPAEADEAQIDEQSVVIRVVVRPDGSAAAAKVLSDPGYGFGQAAVACALRTRFRPALDRAGNPRRALSPPIRVRFTR